MRSHRQHTAHDRYRRRGFTPTHSFQSWPSRVPACSTQTSDGRPLNNVAAIDRHGSRTVRRSQPQETQSMDPIWLIFLVLGIIAFVLIIAGRR